MQPTERVEFELSKSVISALDNAVASGIYPNKNEAVQTALAQQLWHDQPVQHVEELRALCEEGEASGDAAPFTIEEFLAELKNGVTDKK